MNGPYEIGVMMLRLNWAGEANTGHSSRQFGINVLTFVVFLIRDRT